MGKTTLLDHLRKRAKHRALSLDEFEIRRTAKNDPGLFLQENPPPIFIDEIQYAPELLPYIKSWADRSKGKVSFWITGSQHFHLMRGVSESLAGRVAVLKLSGFSQSELLGEPGRVDPCNIMKSLSSLTLPTTNTRKLFSTMLKGSYPRLHTQNPPNIDTFYGSYVQTYIDRDLRDLVRVGSLSSFEKFIRLCAARTAQTLNLSDLARDSDITVNTAKEWLGILEANGHIFLLRPYYQNISKRLIKSPKLYFLDTGLACYLTGWKTPETTMRGAMAGPLFETFVVAEILKSFWNRGMEAPVWYFRTKEGREVDLILERNGILYPIEIKLAARIQERDIQGVINLNKTKARLGPAIIICAASRPYAISPKIAAVPYTLSQYF